MAFPGGKTLIATAAAILLFGSFARAECQADLIRALLEDRGIAVREIDEWVYSVFDQESRDFRGNPRLYFTARLDLSGYIEVYAKTREDGVHSRILRGKELLSAAVNHFRNHGPIRVKGIKAWWSYGDNLDAFNQLTKSGMPADEAAKLTWTGQRAREMGFTRVSGIKTKGQPGAYHDVELHFSDP